MTNMGISKFIKVDSVALVTGASGGIGRAIAIKLAENGALVVINYNKSKEGAEETLRQIHEMGGRGAVIGADVSDPNQVAKMFSLIKQHFNKLDILVNNAGIIKDGFGMMMSTETFEIVIKTNLMGCFYCTQGALRIMCDRKEGSIVNISSISGKSGQIGQANYSASKGAIISLSKTIAKEYADKGIRCNVVVPGFVDTDMTKSNRDVLITNYEKMIPLKRFGEPDEIAQAVLFLASNMSSYITGEVLTVDGGMTM